MIATIPRHFAAPASRLKGLPLGLDRLDLLRRTAVSRAWASDALPFSVASSSQQRYRDHAQKDDEDSQPQVERAQLDKRAGSEIELDAH